MKDWDSALRRASPPCCAGDFAPWSDSSAPDGAQITTDFYVYNITNPAEVSPGARGGRIVACTPPPTGRVQILAGGVPNVQAIGPLRYLYNDRKVNVTWWVRHPV
jgi:hypothetical protein